MNHRTPKFNQGQDVQTPADGIASVLAIIVPRSAKREITYVVERGTWKHSYLESELSAVETKRIV